MFFTLDCRSPHCDNNSNNNNNGHYNNNKALMLSSSAANETRPAAAAQLRFKQIFKNWLLKYFYSKCET